MSKPNGVLQGVAPELLTPRTRAKSACGLPVIQGSVTVGATTGVIRLFAVKIRPLSRKLELVAS